MQLTPLLLLTGALGAVAHPSHAHLHRSAHKRDTQFVKAIHSVIAAPTAAAKPVATSSSSPAPAATGGSGAAAFEPFCPPSKRATAAEIAYAGNTGSKWGCNMKLIDSSIAHLYSYTTAYKNVDTEPYTLICSNKIGPDGGIDGSWYSALTFNLAPGETQHVAFDSNTQGFCAFFKGSNVDKTSFGEAAGSWVEFDFGNASNGGWSGADCSTLVAQSVGMPVYGCQVCTEDGNTCSTILPNGSGTNAYTKGLEAADGLGLNIGQGNVALNVAVGYSG